MKLRNYTLRYLIPALLIVVAVWAALFYALILDEVYDNIDDGLKNSKIIITRQAFADEKILNTPDFGINQFKIKPLAKGGNYDYSDHFISTFEFSEYDNEDQPVRLLETVFNDARGNPHRLTIRASMVEEDELLEDLLLALIALYVMLVASIAVLNQVILRRAWSSFYELMKRLKIYKPGSANGFTAPTTPITEFHSLGTELEAMLRRNDETFASQKQFIENAAHELQTPLAISLNRLELLAENTVLEEKQMAELGKISDTLQRLVRLNKSLLMLSRIENRQFADEELIDFREVTSQLVDEYADLADYKGIELKLKAEQPLFFTMNKGLAYTLIGNLIKNAIMHNIGGGEVLIEVGSQNITVSNTGSAEPLDTNRIFRRFTKGTSGESTGLGLSIVSSIAVNYNILVSYQFDGNHKFSLIFP